MFDKIDLIKQNGYAPTHIFDIGAHIMDIGFAYIVMKNQ
jgi:hypothetical protein